MRPFVTAIVLIVVLMNSSAQGMIKNFNKIKFPKNKPRYFGANTKNFNTKSEYPKTENSLLKDVVIDKPVNIVPAKTPSEAVKIKVEEMPNEAWKTEKNQKLVPSKKEQAKVSSPIKVPQRNYSTIKGTPFRKSFHLLGIKTAEAKNDLQIRRYGTLDQQKANFLKKVATQITEEKIPAYLKDPSVRDRFSNIIRSRSIEKFAKESDELTQAKRELGRKTKGKEFEIKIPASDLVLLSYEDVSKVKKKLLSPEYSSFLPMAELALNAERTALKNNKVVLYHGMSTKLYKWLYICTKIMDFGGKSYRGFLNLRLPNQKYMPNPTEDHNAIRTTYLEQGSRIDESPKDQYHLLSCSNSLFTCFDRNLEGPFDFLIADPSYRMKINLDFLKEFCKSYGLENYYFDILKLGQYTEIETDGGVLLQFILNQDLCNKTVYASYAYGRTDEELKAQNIVKNITNMGIFDDSTIAKIQFRMILTQDLLLNPRQDGVIINTYTKEQDAVNNFKKTANTLFAKIKRYKEQNKITNFTKYMLKHKTKYKQ